MKGILVLGPTCACTDNACGPQCPKHGKRSEASGSQVLSCRQSGDSGIWTIDCSHGKKLLWPMSKQLQLPRKFKHLMSNGVGRSNGNTSYVTTFRNPDSKLLSAPIPAWGDWLKAVETWQPLIDLTCGRPHKSNYLQSRRSHNFRNWALEVDNDMHFLWRSWIKYTVRCFSMSRLAPKLHPNYSIGATKAPNKSPKAQRKLAYYTRESPRPAKRPWPLFETLFSVGKHIEETRN